MLCCMRRTKQVEKNDEDQKIEQDGIKPEDKAHKAATKIQASFRGHITRKKLNSTLKLPFLSCSHL
uniref:Neuromodulin n=1 Tax=Pipistrellus kuhlii TaxID=59472 RepID=A0A7J8A662_PIPKU|nr:growth associated protein 43 [Pipistrellus kuhlii]